ncbi:BnaA08g28000D [Brassica napus]|uniref:BnaA08g28000D protein n=1 Tax=Brassica napus TaxID=3708 RepID=A0A078FQX8_BRANA|nr:BnaA08g28000D [Brassica napus]
MSRVLSVVCVLLVMSFVHARARQVPGEFDEGKTTPHEDTKTTSMHAPDKSPPTSLGDKKCIGLIGGLGGIGKYGGIGGAAGIGGFHGIGGIGKYGGIGGAAGIGGFHGKAGGIGGVGGIGGGHGVVGAVGGGIVPHP